MRSEIRIWRRQIIVDLVEGKAEARDNCPSPPFLAFGILYTNPTQKTYISFPSGHV